VPIVKRGFPMASVPGWYADPTGRSELRYWDGSAWTERTKNRSQGSEGKKVEPGQVKKKGGRPRSEICFVIWFWRNQTDQQRRIRKDYPYEIWFAARALGPDGLYIAAQGDLAFNASSNNYYHSGNYNARFASILPWNDDSVDCFNDLVQKLWADGWEPSSGGGKGSLWYEYRFRRPVAE
jgi:hypothetical protein